MSLVMWEAGGQIRQVRRDPVSLAAAKVSSCSACGDWRPRIPRTQQDPPRAFLDIPTPPPPQPGHGRRSIPPSSRRTNSQASPSYTEASPVLTDLSVHPAAPRSGMPFAAIGLPGLQPWPPPSSPSSRFTPHMRKGLPRRLSRTKRVGEGR